MLKVDLLLVEYAQSAYEYTEKFVHENKAQKVVIDGIASSVVIASLLHGIHPAEGALVPKTFGVG